jgi:hypothetical protein
VILEALYSLVKLLIGALVLLLPTYTPPPGIGLSVLSAANFVLPLSELGLLLGAVGVYASAGLIYTGVMRVFKFIRGAG